MLSGLGQLFLAPRDLAPRVQEGVSGNSSQLVPGLAPHGQEDVQLRCSWSQVLHRAVRRMKLRVDGKTFETLLPVRPLQFGTILGRQKIGQFAHEIAEEAVCVLQNLRRPGESRETAFIWGGLIVSSCDPDAIHEASYWLRTS